MLNFVKSESGTRPDTIDKTSSQSTIYLRRNIREAQREDMDGNAVTYYEYEEAKLTPEEYEEYVKVAEAMEIGTRLADIEIALCDLSEQLMTTEL